MSEPPKEKDCKHFIPLPFPSAPYGKCAAGHLHNWDGKKLGTDGRVNGNYEATCKGGVKFCFEQKEKPKSGERFAKGVEK